MIKLRKLALDILFMLKKLGVDDAECTINDESTDETNSLGKVVYLLREFDSIKIELHIVKDEASAQIIINQADYDSLEAAAKKCVSMLDAQKPYKPYEIGYKGEIEPDKILSFKRDPEKLYKRFEELMDTIKTEYPTIASDAMAWYKDSKMLYLNTQGQELTNHTQSCGFGWQGNAVGENDVTDINFTGVYDLNLDEPIMSQGMVRATLDKTLKLFNPQPIKKGKFVGTIIIDPEALPRYAHEIITRIKNMKDGDGYPIPICSPCIDIFEAHSNVAYASNMNAHNSEQADVKYYIKNGEIQPDPEASMSPEEKTKYYTNQQKKYQILDKKVLGVSGGTIPYERLIKNVKQGLLIGYINGSQASPDGEFSGVAKNSFYIENGEIKFPVIETMVSGNTFDMFKNVVGVSQETVASNGILAPWVAFDGVTII